MCMLRVRTEVQFNFLQNTQFLGCFVYNLIYEEKGIQLRRTKAYVVINARKTAKAGLIAAVIIGLLWMMMSKPFADLTWTSVKKATLEKDKYEEISPLFAVKNSAEGENAEDTPFRWLNILINKRVEKPASLLASEIFAVSGIKPALAAAHQYVNEGNFYFEPPKKNEKREVDVPNKKEPGPAVETTIASIKNTDELSKKGITIKNNTTYNIDYNKLFSEPLKLTKPKNGEPQVLIVHTHGTESYNPDTRSEDISNNMIRVGDEMEKVFKENGINVIHSQIMHDIPQYNNSYRKALNTIEATVKEHPSIQVVLDIHRDAMTNKNDEKFKVVANINGEKVAQVMIVVGTNQMGLPNDHWQENLKFAMKCQESINQSYPGLTRPIDLRQERFNMHATLGSLIIEVGTHGNTLEEAVKSGAYTAEAISKVLNGVK